LAFGCAVFRCVVVWWAVCEVYSVQVCWCEVCGVQCVDVQVLGCAVGSM
jgi:hypothetical protein